MKLNCATVKDFFSSIKDSEIESYNDYWAEMKPQTDRAAFRRYLFAFMSVHTSWQNNCKGYNGIKDFTKWVDKRNEGLYSYNAEKLFDKIRRARVGFQNNRTNFIGTFYDNFWGNTDNYIRPADGEGWAAWRDRISKKILGLGNAKTSFAIEMLHPTEAQVVCLDTHLFQVYGLNQTKHGKYYHRIEKDWLKRSKKVGVAPYIARCIYWDRKQNRKNSRYWSWVLEA
tara:strand:- start:1164 stop:1844 length:681 start_codon:yes stop_codon:yes gene_type:complete